MELHVPRCHRGLPLSDGMCAVLGRTGRLGVGAGGQDEAGAEVALPICWMSFTFGVKGEEATRVGRNDVCIA